MGKEERAERRAERQSGKKKMTDEGWVAPTEPSGLEYEDMMKAMLGKRQQATQAITEKAGAMQQQSGSRAKALHAIADHRTMMLKQARTKGLEAPLVRGAVTPTDVPVVVPPIGDPNPALAAALKQWMVEGYPFREGSQTEAPKRILTGEEIEAEPEVTPEELETFMGGG